mmetsp:Transcript_16747/g.27183  ORF Transcript_16747/g.27183 Transcript_16747/m.27183 type:complete len:91 (-) Transcript_16747:120-392(-)
MLSFVGASASSLTDTTTSAKENKTVKIITIISGIVFGGAGIYAASYYSKLELDRILTAPQSVPAISSTTEDVGSVESLLLPPGSNESAEE